MTATTPVAAGIVGNRTALIAYAVYGLLRGEPVRVCLGELRTVPTCLARGIVPVQDTLEAIPGALYRLHREIKHDPDWLPSLGLSQWWGVRLLQRVLRTDKVAHHFNYGADRFLFAFRRDLILHDRGNTQVRYVLPMLLPYRRAAARWLDGRPCDWSPTLTVAFWILGVLSAMKNLFYSLLMVPVFRRRHQGRAVLELTRFLPNSRLSSDFLVDGQSVKQQDLVFFSSGASSSKTARQQAYDEALARGMPVVRTDSATFNLGAAMFVGLILVSSTVLLFPLVCLGWPSLLVTWTAFVAETSRYLRIFSFCRTPFYYDLQCVSQQAAACAAASLHMQSVSLFYSDILQYDSFDHSHCAVDKIMVWGPLMAHAIGPHSPSSQVYAAGCRFLRQPGDHANALRHQLLPEPARKIISFFDSSIGPGGPFAETDLDGFIRLMLACRKRFPDCAVSYKPKSAAHRHRWEMLRNTGVTVLEPDKVGFFQVILASDACIGLGLNSTITISLINGVPGLYYDTIGNNYHPLTEYSNRLVFSEPGPLLDELERILKQGQDLSDVTELADIAVPGLDGTETLRQFLCTGEIDPAYRVPQTGDAVPSPGKF